MVASEIINQIIGIQLTNLMALALDNTVHNFKYIRYHLVSNSPDTSNHDPILVNFS